MVSGYLETSMVAGPCSYLSMRALVSASSWSSARAPPAPNRTSTATPRRDALNLLFVRISAILACLEPIGKLNDKLAGGQPIGIETAVVQPFVVTFQQQRVREVIDKTGGITIGGRSHRVIGRVVAPDQFQIVHDGRIQIQARQFITRLDPPTFGLDGSGVVRFLPGIDILALHFKIRTDVNRGIHHKGR